MLPTLQSTFSVSHAKGAALFPASIGAALSAKFQDSTDSLAAFAAAAASSCFCFTMAFLLGSFTLDAFFWGPDLETVDEI